MVRNYTRKTRTKCKKPNRHKNTNEEHIYEYNGMIMEGKDEGKGSL